jgi:flagellar protein FlgJ
MFYARINKIKVFNNREGFLGLFNRAELRIYSIVRGMENETGKVPLTIADLIDLTDEQRKERLLAAVLSETERFAQCHSLAINGVKDNQSLTFGDAGLVIYESNHIPDALYLQLWAIESDSDVRQWAVDAGAVLDSNAFKGLWAAVSAALAVPNPVFAGAIAVGGVVTNLLRQKLKANKDDLVGYWQATLNREEHYPHGARDRQDSPDTTGNILVDYTLFGFENEVHGLQEEGHVNADANKGFQPLVEYSDDNDDKGFQPLAVDTPQSDFIRQIYPAAQRLYEASDGLHPLFVTAQAALETGWKIKAAGNNIFGITKGASWTGATNLLLTAEIFDTPDRQFMPPEKVVSVKPLASGKYRYKVYRQFRAYDSLEESLNDHLALLKGKLYQDAWPYRHDPREYARRIAGIYATSPDYAKTLVAVMEKCLNLDLPDLQDSHDGDNPLIV